MTFKSDKQRKGFFANRGNQKASIKPIIINEKIGVVKDFEFTRKTFPQDKIDILDNRLHRIARKFKSKVKTEFTGDDDSGELRATFSKDVKGLRPEIRKKIKGGVIIKESDKDFKDEGFP